MDLQIVDQQPRPKTRQSAKVSDLNPEESHKNPAVLRGILLEEYNMEVRNVCVFYWVLIYWLITDSIRLSIRLCAPPP